MKQRIIFLILCLLAALAARASEELVKDYIGEWGYEIADHGSVPYAATLTKVQTPRRKGAASVQASPKPNVVPQSFP